MAGMAGKVASPMAPVSSRSIEEARARSKMLFRHLARQVPWMLRSFQLEEATDVPTFRSKLADEFRKNRHLTNYKALDMMLFKAQDDLTQLMTKDYQRHHLVEKFLQKPEPSTLQHGVPSDQSSFLTNFLRGH